MKGLLQLCLLIGLGFPKETICFGGGEEKFLRKYAMMKVYESCFGAQVLKEIRKEMRDAANKCSGVQAPNYDDKFLIKDGNNIKQSSSMEWLQEPPYRLKPNLGTKVKKPIHTTDTLLLQQWTEEQKLGSTDDGPSEEQDQLETESGSNAEVETSSPTPKPVDLSKLEEAIMNIGKPMFQKPASSDSNFKQSATVGYYPALYYPPPLPFGPSYPYQPYYPGYFQTPGPMNTAAFQSFYRSGHRAAKITSFSTRARKQFDLKPNLDSIAFQYSTKIRNITCIMQELGYLDDQLEPNYAKMNERINKLYIPDELKKDMQDGIKFCRQFSQCVPETRKDSFQLSRELLRPMFFFRCYKQKKLESCIMKDIRERFVQSSELTNQVRRSFRNNDVVSSVFDSIFGPSADDFDSLL